MKKSISLVFLVVFLFNIFNAFTQTPYNFKIHDFNKKSVQLESLLPTSSGNFAFMGLYTDTIPGMSDYVTTNSMFGVLNKNFEPICLNEINPTELSGGIRFFSDFIQVSNDSFLACGTLLEFDSSGTIINNSLYLISFNDDCEYNVVNQIPSPYLLSKQVLSVESIQFGPDSIYFYILYTASNPSNHNNYNACLVKLDSNLNIVWNNCYSTNQNNLSCRAPLIFTDSNRIVLPARKWSYANVDEVTSHLMFITLDEISGEKKIHREFSEDHHMFSNIQFLNNPLDSATYFFAPGIDSVYFPFPNIPEKEYVTYKNSIGLTDLKGQFYWNKPIGDKGWYYDQGFEKIIHSNQMDGIIATGSQVYKYYWTDTVFGLTGIIAKSDYYGNEQWKRYIQYNPTPYEVQFLSRDIVSAGEQGYVGMGQILFMNSDTVYSKYPSIFYYFDEQGCIIPGCETVNQTSIQQNRISLLTYPNPASGHLYVYVPTIEELNPQNPAYLKIHDMNGQLIHSEPVNFSDNTLILDSQHWANGIYMANLMNKGVIIARQKIVIQK